MWSTEASSESAAPAGVLWKLWSDVPGWSQWDPDVQWSTLEGQFREGVAGRLKPKGGPPVQFTLTEVEEQRAFTDSASLPLAKMTFRHRLEPTATGGTKITHRVEIDGPLGGLFGLMLGRGIRAGLPTAVTRLARLAEELHGANA